MAVILQVHADDSFLRFIRPAGGQPDLAARRTGGRPGQRVPYRR